MRFEIYGGFKVPLEDHGVVLRGASGRNSFWNSVDQTEAGLRDACGCYVFAMKSGGGFTPWYVGKAEKSSFEQECFTAHKLNCYDYSIAKYSIGTPLLYFVAMHTPGGQFSKPSSAGNPSIAFLERWLIGQALNKNPNLCNIKDTKFLKELIVRGLINSPPGAPPKPAKELKEILE
jgi:hypothetical protein